MLSQKPEGQRVCVCVCVCVNQLQKLVKNKIRKKEDYSTGLARIFVHEQHSHITGKMCQ